MSMLFKQASPYSLWFLYEPVIFIEGITFFTRIELLWLINAPEDLKLTLYGKLISGPD